MNMTPQVDTNKLKQAEAALAIGKGLVTTAIQQSASDQLQCEEALKQASAEIAQAQTYVSQAQSSMQSSTTLE
jgi:hypothetical protein